MVGVVIESELGEAVMVRIGGCLHQKSIGK